jgi:hypothetical protein
MQLAPRKGHAAKDIPHFMIPTAATAASYQAQQAQQHCWHPAISSRAATTNAVALLLDSFQSAAAYTCTVSYLMPRHPP